MVSYILMHFLAGRNAFLLVMNTAIYENLWAGNLKKIFQNPKFMASNFSESKAKF